MSSFLRLPSANKLRQMVDDQIRLLAFQQTLEQEVQGSKYVGLSINETIHACIVRGNGKKADKLRADWKVPDKRSVRHYPLSEWSLTKGRWWYIKLKSLIELRDWDALETFAKSKKSPIGYEPFVDLLVATGSSRQALNFVQRCETKNRADLYVKCSDWVAAGQECVKRTDRTKLL